ncbi:MAG: hypothetical protein U0271_37605 [Polyangiaceae bacterium]
MGSFFQNDLEFEMDHDGALVDDPEEIQLDVAYDDLKVEGDSAEAELARRLSVLTEETVEPDELFDLAVRRQGKIVAALVLAVQDDAVELAGERARDVTDEDLAEAIVAALRRVG